MRKLLWPHFITVPVGVEAGGIIPPAEALAKMTPLLSDVSRAATEGPQTSPVECARIPWLRVFNIRLEIS
jgi:hypothetical protein